MLIWIWTFLFFACSLTGNENASSTNNGTNLSQGKVASGSQFAPDPEEIEGTTEPTSSKDGSILERHKKLGKNPAYVVVLWLEAAIRAQNNEQEGWDALQYLTIPLKDEPNWKKSQANAFFVPEIENKNPSFRSCIVGATPENGYMIDINNLSIEVHSEGRPSANGRKLMIRCSGANMPRPISLQQSDQSGLYYVKEFSTMYVDVMPPVDPIIH